MVTDRGAVEPWTVLLWILGTTEYRREQQAGRECLKAGESDQMPI
jgi:hypothetical protein